MVVGLDFDNTLVDHRRSLWQSARDAGWIPDGFPVDKLRIREHLRCTRGNEAWTEIQAAAYGKGMTNAQLFPGVEAFLERCQSQNVRIHVVSHKTRWSAVGAVDLHFHALRFLEDSGLIDGEKPLLEFSRIHFERTRPAKVARIRALGCTHFVDDLEETFLEPGFPDLHRFLFQPEGIPASEKPWRTASDWDQLAEWILP